MKYAAKTSATAVWDTIDKLAICHAYNKSDCDFWRGRGTECSDSFVIGSEKSCASARLLAATLKEFNLVEKLENI